MRAMYHYNYIKKKMSKIDQTQPPSQRFRHTLRACSVSSQSMWIEWDWMSFNPKQVKLLLIFFQSHPIHMY
jgi:hypothetical protein